MPPCLVLRVSPEKNNVRVFENRISAMRCEGLGSILSLRFYVFLSPPLPPFLCPPSETPTIQSRWRNWKPWGKFSWGAFEQENDFR
mmetsp:Transcript_3770/g.3882  ORF Transcript_3770/g.3882 Transcript_3770/m.3882 type:complete len:86 (-) Transcript_3770:277-534(-)